MQTIDTKFDEIESKVLSLETELRTVLKDISTWIEELQVHKSVISSNLSQLN